MQSVRIILTKVFFNPLSAGLPFLSLQIVRHYLVCLVRGFFSFKTDNINIVQTGACAVPRIHSDMISIVIEFGVVCVCKLSLTLVR